MGERNGNIAKTDFLLTVLFSVHKFDSVAVGFYILLRAVDRFAANYNSFPGQFDG